MQPATRSCGNSPKVVGEVVPSTPQYGGEQNAPPSGRPSRQKKDLAGSRSPGLAESRSPRLGTGLAVGLSQQEATRQWSEGSVAEEWLWDRVGSADVAYLTRRCCYLLGGGDVLSRVPLGLYMHVLYLLCMRSEQVWYTFRTFSVLLFSACCVHVGVDHFRELFHLVCCWASTVASWKVRGTNVPKEHPA